MFHHCNLESCSFWTKSGKEPGFVFIRFSMKAGNELYFCSAKHAAQYLLSLDGEP